MVLASFAQASSSAPAAAAEISLRTPRLRLPPSTHPEYRRALRLDLRGDHAAAAQAYRAAARESPAAAVRARFQWKLSDAIAKLREGLRRAPDSYDEHFNYAVNAQNKYWALFLDLGVRDHRLAMLAEHHFKESLRLSPVAANPLLCLASLYGQTGDRARASELYRSMAGRTVRPSDYYNLAFFHKVLGEMEDAYRVLRMAIAFDARHREWIAASDDYAEYKDDPRLRAIVDEGGPHGDSLGRTLRLHNPRWSMKPRVRILRNFPRRPGPVPNPFPALSYAPEMP